MMEAVRALGLAARFVSGYLYVPERDTGERVIGENYHFIVLAPYAPRFPFEVWLLPKVHGSAYENNQSSMYSSLAAMMKDTIMRLEAVLDRPAFNFIIHTSPIGEEINDH